MEEDMREMSFEELGALCTNLSKACSKQLRSEEAALFAQLSDYYQKKSKRELGRSFKDLSALIEKDLQEGYAAANLIATEQNDRGTLRALVWGEKVTKLLKSLLMRYEKQQGALLEKTNVYVCEICGFVYVGDVPPAVCPICKVPSFKILPVVKEAV